MTTTAADRPGGAGWKPADARKPEDPTGALEVPYYSRLLQLVQHMQLATSVSPYPVTIRDGFGSKRPEVRILSPRPP